MNDVPEKTRRSPVGRVVTWSLIAVLAAITGTEAAARFGYSESLTALENLDFEASESGIELAEVEKTISGWTRRSTTDDGTVVFRWINLLKHYEVSLKPEPGQVDRIVSFETAMATDESIPIPTLPDVIPVAPLNPSAASMPSGGRGGGGGGGGGGGDAGTARRREEGLRGRQVGPVAGPPTAVPVST